MLRHIPFILLLLLCPTFLLAESFSKRDLARLHVRTWELHSIKRPREPELIADEFCKERVQRPTLKFKVDGSFWGGLFCNSVSGRYYVENGGFFSFPELSMTSQGCAGVEFSDDEMLFELFDKVRNGRISDDKLELSSEKGVKLIYQIKRKPRKDNVPSE